jgi:hypothetical protein
MRKDSGVRSQEKEKITVNRPRHGTQRAQSSDPEAAGGHKVCGIFFPNNDVEEKCIANSFDLSDSVSALCALCVHCFVFVVL